MESERERARRVLAVVRALPPGVLDVAAASAPPESAALITAVQAALAAPDPEGRLVDALRGVPVAPTTEGDLNAALQQVARFADAVAPVGASLDAILVGREGLAARGLGVREAIAEEDPGLGALVDEAIALLGDAGPLAALKATLAAVRELQHGLAELARGEGDPAALARRVSELRVQRDAIAAVRDDLARVPTLIAEARRFLEARGDAPGVARLAAAEAALRDREPGTEARWEDALDRAVAAELLPLARDAARRTARAAMATGEFERVAGAAAKVVDLAVQAGDVDAELEALGDQALALSRLPGGADRARELVTWARKLAAGEAVRAIRARLLEGLVIERLGDEAGARRAFRKVMEAASEVDGVRYELAWAALHLGKLEAAAGQRFRAGQDLELAQQLGFAAGDALLYTLAADARLELAADRATAEAVLGDLDRAPPAVREVLQRRFDERWRAR